MAGTASPGAQDAQYPVQLFVYDLSNGLARSLSAQLTGRQFDAIYHTSIVVHNREWFFGQGIGNAAPGQSHFGSPIERIQLGQTSIDRDTFQELLSDLAERYTPQSYHLLHFNCNTFSNELANILVGRDIPAHITSLPQDFLATPFGRMMGPQIDAMFRSPGMPVSGVSSAHAANGANPAAAGILHNIAQQAYGSTPHASVPTQSHVREITSGNIFDGVRNASKCFVVLFTSQTCPPCVQLHPVYESLAEEYGKPEASRERSIVFGKVESTPATSPLIARLGIRATPTVQFYLNGEMTRELKGANQASLRDGIEELLWHTYLPHPHSKMQSPLALVPAKPIVLKGIPNLMSAQSKLDDILSKHKASSFAQKADIQDARGVLTKVLIPWIRNGPACGKSSTMSESDIRAWTRSARKCINILDSQNIFPVVDLIRIAMVDAKQALALSSIDERALLSDICAKAKAHMDRVQDNKATLLTSYKLIANVLALDNDVLTRQLNDAGNLVALLVSGVLCEDGGVRNAAINASFNWARTLAKNRTGFVQVAKAKKDGGDGAVDSESSAGPADEEVELLCAVLECIEKEDDAERREFAPDR